MESVIIYGAGIAGLSAAHELNQLGHKVSVYEAMEQPGGFFRSARSSPIHRYLLRFQSHCQPRIEE